MQACKWAVDANAHEPGIVVEYVASSCCPRACTATTADGLPGCAVVVVESGCAICLIDQQPRSRAGNCVSFDSCHTWSQHTTGGRLYIQHR